MTRSRWSFGRTNPVIVDQILFSAGSAVLSIAVARALATVGDYGRFGIIVLIGVAFQGVIRSAGFFEYVREGSAESLDDCVAATRLVTLFAGVLVVGLAWNLTGGPVDALLAASGVALVGLHESMRLLALKAGRSRWAVSSELAWALPACALLVASLAWGQGLELRGALLAYASCGAFGSVCLLKVLWRGHVQQGARSIARRWRVFALNSIEQSLGAFGGLGLIAAISWSVSESAAGEVRVGLVLVGPAAVVVQGIATTVAMHHPLRPGYRRTVLQSFFLSGAAFGLVGLLAASPLLKGLLRRVVGSAFELSYLAPVVLFVGGEAMLIILASSLRSRGKALPALIVRAVTAAAGLCAGLIGTRMGVAVTGVSLALAAICVCVASFRSAGRADVSPDAPTLWGIRGSG